MKSTSTTISVDAVDYDITLSGAALAVAADANPIPTLGPSALTLLGLLLAALVVRARIHGR